jgi:hypothetical protein
MNAVVSHLFVANRKANREITKVVGGLIKDKLTKL